MSAGTTTRVPTEHHLIHYLCIATTTGRKSPTGRGRLHPGITAINGTLHINGRSVGMTSDIIQANSNQAFAFWNITDPLPEGTHEVEFQLTVPNNSQGHHRHESGLPESYPSTGSPETKSYYSDNYRCPSRRYPVTA